MNIGIDIDGVLLDSMGWLEFYADFFARYEIGKNKVRDDSAYPEVNYNFTDEETSAFYAKYNDLSTKNSSLVPGASEILKKLEEDGHNLFILTARGIYNEREIKFCEPKLKQLGVTFKKIEWALRDKSDACEKFNLDVFIEDNPEHIKKVLRTNTKIIQFKSELSHVETVSDKRVSLAKNWNDVYDIILAMSPRN